MQRSSTQTVERQRTNRLSVPLIDSRAKGRSLGLERYLVKKLYRVAGEPPLTIQLWDGNRVGSDRTDYVLHIRDRGALYHLLGDAETAFGDLYSQGRIEVEGDFPSFLDTLFRRMHQSEEKRPAWLRWLWAVKPNSGADLDDARNNIHHHYDLGNDFYRLWLDREAMQYTCAYYETPDMSLEQAQQAKMEHVCRKLKLKPGQTVIEAGCGWGGLARYMAREYGVKVRAFNISKEQLEFAREQARKEGLEDRVEYVEDDYRNISGHCDRFVSVGMLEHVGPANYGALAEAVNRSLDPRGIGLIHTIGRNKPMAMNGWIEKRIFPGAYPPAITELMAMFEGGDLSVLDVENLRLHYASTLDHWLERFETHHDRVREQYDEAFVRAWRLYLAGSAASFRNGSLQLFQVVFAPASNNDVPANRRHLYARPVGERGGLEDGAV